MFVFLLFSDICWSDFGISTVSGRNICNAIPCY